MSVSPWCKVHPHTEFWGDVVLDGGTNKQPSEGACCDSCKSHGLDGKKKQCTVWVYNPVNWQCWLKFDDNPNPEPHEQGAGVVRPARYRPPRHPPHFRPSFL